MRLVVVPNLRGTSRQGVWVVLAVLVAAALAASLLLLMMVASPARADITFTVKSKADTDGMTCGPSDCTLRQAINAANAAPGNDTIVFALGPTATITLGSTLPTITDASGLTIDGQSASITISGNEQVRVFEVAAGAELALSKLTVANGSAGLGGGIKNEGGTLKVTDSTFSDNNAVGAGSAPVSCENACLGGGIQNDGGTLTVIRSTFSGNKSDAIGGGISNVNGGTLKIINSTFSGNGAGFVGGAINNGGKLEVTYSTFSDNVGGGINNANAAGVTLTLSNTILANSTGGNIREVCAGGTCQGKITDGGYNISDDNSTSEFFTDQTSKSNTKPRLAGGLANNGGPTQTIALLEGSPALNAIPKAENGCGTEITTDQRGVTRPQFAACDIGAYELAQASPAPPPSPPSVPPDDECTITGTEGDDVLTGTSEADVICGLGGNDTIKGKAGDDTILGGEGDDTLYGGKGKDTIYGGEGKDSISGGKGADTLIGGSRDSASGSSISTSATTEETSAKDTLDGGKGKDTCEAGSNGTESRC